MAEVIQRHAGTVTLSPVLKLLGNATVFFPKQIQTTYIQKESNQTLAVLIVFLIDRSNAMKGLIWACGLQENIFYRDGKA